MNIQKIREEALKAISDKDVKYLIGYKQGSYGFRISPVFIRNKDEVESLVFNPLCQLGLVTYLTKDEVIPIVDEAKKHASKIAILVRGCDSRAINQLVAEKGIPRESLYIIGIPCTGVIELKKIENKFPGVSSNADVKEEGDNYIITVDDQTHTVPKQELLAELCKTCPHPSPLSYDKLAGDEIKSKTDTFEDIKLWEEKPAEERFDFWLNQFDRCIRCYACRNACPLCYSIVCTLEDTQWVKRSSTTSENFMFHMTAAFHLAGRCINCGECERVCPMELPIMKLNRKLEKDARELFGHESGKTADTKTPLTSFELEDKEDFIL